MMPLPHPALNLMPFFRLKNHGRNPSLEFPEHVTIRRLQNATWQFPGRVSYLWLFSPQPRTTWNETRHNLWNKFPSQKSPKNLPFEKDDSHQKVGDAFERFTFH